jgi:hypothetical protein
VLDRTRFSTAQCVSDDTRVRARVDVIMCSIVAFWARTQMRSIVSCLGSIVDTLDCNSMRSIALAGTFYSFANFHPQTAFFC